MCCSDIGMEFGISKCAVFSMKRGKNPRLKEYPFLQVKRWMIPMKMPTYLGILELDEILNNEMKLKVKTSYFKRLKLLLKSKLNSKNLFLAINSWAVALIRYGAGIIDWTKYEISEMDRKTRKPSLYEEKTWRTRVDQH